MTKEEFRRERIEATKNSLKIGLKFKYNLMNITQEGEEQSKMKCNICCSTEHDASFHKSKTLVPPPEDAYLDARYYLNGAVSITKGIISEQIINICKELATKWNTVVKYSRRGNLHEFVMQCDDVDSRIIVAGDSNLKYVI